MRLYEINSAIEQLIDPESGEIMDFDSFAELAMEREVKLENLACWVKNLRSDVTSLKEEEKSLKERRESKERRIDSLSIYLDQMLDGQKFETAKCKVSFRASKRLIIQDEDAFIEHANTDYVIPQHPKIDKAAIKAAIKSGQLIDGADIVEARNIQIK